MTSGISLPNELLTRLRVMAAERGTSVAALIRQARRRDHAGPLARALGPASFAAYIVHAPVVVLLSVGLRSVPVLAVFALGAAASFGLGWLVTRWRFAARIL